MKGEPIMFEVTTKYAIKLLAELSQSSQPFLYKEHKKALDMGINALKNEELKNKNNNMAYWIDKDGISDFFYCSNCNYKAYYTEVKEKCPKCNAKMNGSLSIDEDMTPNEAIEILKTHLLLPRITGTREEDIEPYIKAEKALNMAILALKENEKLKEENEALHHINAVRHNEILQKLREENDCLKNTLNKINQIVSETNRRESILVNNYPKIVTKSRGFDQISEVFKDE